MTKTIGKALLLIGVLFTIAIAIKGWRQEIFVLSQTSISLGLRRTFYLFLYFPIAIGIAIAGAILAFGEYTHHVFVKRIALTASLFLLALAVGFLVMNVIYNIRFYEGAGLIAVLLMNGVFVLPLLCLSGLFFLVSRGAAIKSRRVSETDSHSTQLFS